MYTETVQSIRVVVACCLVIGGVLWPWRATAQPPIAAWESTNGARVLFVSASEIPMLDVRVVFAAGSARDGDTAGLAHLTNRLLDDGAGELDTNAIAERFDTVGARFSTMADRDMAGVGLRMLTDPALAAPALETFALVLGSPAFPPQAFARERSRMQVAARLRHQSADAIAAEAFWQAVYRDHPYAQPPGGTVESLATLTREQTVAFYRRYYVVQNAVVAMVGNVSRAQAEEVAETMLRGLPAGQAAPALPPVPPLAAARTVRKPFPSSQTHVLVGQPGISRGDPLYFPLSVGNHVLGGSGLVSQLFQEVRAERGLSYSAYSILLPMARQGPFMAGLQTRNARAEPALHVLRDTLRRFIEQGPTTEALALAKQHLIGSFPLQLDSNQKLVDVLAMMGFYDLPLDYLARFPARVQAVAVAAVHTAFQARLSYERLVTVVVGGAIDTPE